MNIIDWFTSWFTPDIILFLDGVFVGFLLTIIVIILYDWLLERR